MKKINIYLMCILILVGLLFAGCENKKMYISNTEEVNEYDEYHTYDSNNINEENDSTEIQNDISEGIENDESETINDIVETTMKENNEEDITEIKETSHENKTINKHEDNTQKTTCNNVTIIIPDIEENTTENEEKKIAKEIVSDIITEDMSELEKATAIHDWIIYNVDYDYKNYNNGTIPRESYTALGAFKNGKAVCSGYANAFLELASIAELEVIYISGHANNGRGYAGHAWNQVKIDGIWYNVDTTWDDPTYENKSPDDHLNNRYDYFLISDKTIEIDHITKTEKNACLYDYDGEAIAKAIEKAGVADALYFEENSDIENKINMLIDSGKTIWVIRTKADKEFKETVAKLAKGGTNIEMFLITNFRNHIQEYLIKVKGNAKYVENREEIVDVINKFSKNKENHVTIWYYNPAFTEENYMNLLGGALFENISALLDFEYFDKLKILKIDCTLIE